MTIDNEKFQTRSETTGLRFFATLQSAKVAAALDHTIWKISFTDENGERKRFVKQDGNWIHQELLAEKNGRSVDPLPY